MVLAIQGGRKALEIIQREDFELVITDLVMPDVSGWDIARTVKQKEVGTPVILLTGCAEMLGDGDLSKRCVDLLLAKPISRQELIESVERLCPF